MQVINIGELSPTVEYTYRSLVHHLSGSFLQCSGLLQHLVQLQ